MKQRIQKLLSAAGVASRRNIEQMVLDGRISVNGEIVMELPILVDPEKDRIDVDGFLIKLKSKAVQRRFYLMMNKPRGVVCTNTPQGEQKTIYKLLDPNEVPSRVYPVGRLDTDTKGLLLLTNDGDLTNRLTHPKFGITQVYRVIIDGILTASTIAKLEKGVWLADEKTGEGFKSSITGIKQTRQAGDRSILEITIKEGRNKQIRRLLAKVGHKVRDLTRIHFGPLSVEGLATGKYRQLTPEELQTLQRVARASDSSGPSKKKKSAAKKPKPEKHFDNEGPGPVEEDDLLDD